MLRLLTQKGRSAVSAVRFLHSAAAMDLSEVTAVLQKFAPPSLAGGWDNVGLLVEPSAPHCVKKMLLTNDLTTPVMQEAIDLKVDMILSYHPPIFAPLKRLRQAKWKERIVIQCLENRIALYSPHTSYDAVKGGVNDWLIQPFKGQSRPIESVTTSMNTPGKYKLEASVPAHTADTCLQHVGTLPDAKLVSKYWFEDTAGSKFLRIALNAKDSGLPALLDYFNQDAEIKSSVEISELTKPIIPHHGPGRLCRLEKELPLSAAVDLVKQHLKLQHVRLAKVVTAEADPVVRSVAVCAGSGSSVLRGVDADLYVTGEMSHHEVLDAVHTGHSVILCDHSNTERGYLTSLQANLTGLLDGRVELHVAQKDEDPLQVV